MNNKSRRFAGVHDFYPFYLSQHTEPKNRALHLIGTSLFLGLSVFMVATRNWHLAPLLPVAGYGFAWFGHFVIEKNKPATFSHPFLSFVCDFRMFFDILRFRISVVEPRDDFTR